MVIKNLNPQAFNGNYDYPGETYKVEGNLTTDGQKNLSNISGQVKDGEVFKASFNAYRTGDNHFRYNFNDIQDVSELAAIASEVENAVAAVISELSE